MKPLIPGEPERSASMSDAELVHAARRGDKRAFVEIVARHQAMVCGIALRILGDFAASEDARRSLRNRTNRLCLTRSPQRRKKPRWRESHWPNCPRRTACRWSFFIARAIQ